MTESTTMPPRNQVPLAETWSGGGSRTRPSPAGWAGLPKATSTNTGSNPSPDLEVK